MLEAVVGRILRSMRGRNLRVPARSRMTDATGEFLLSSVIRAYDGKRCAIEAGSRSYIGRLQCSGEVVCVQEDDRTISWIAMSAVHGIRVFPQGETPAWLEKR